MSAPGSDRNLLFGIVALQLNFIDRDALVGAMHAWVLDKSRPLGHILQEQGRLAADVRGMLDGLVDRHIRDHGGDPQQSLAALSSVSSARAALQPILDSDLQASIVQLWAGSDAQPGADPHGTVYGSKPDPH